MKMLISFSLLIFIGCVSNKCENGTVRFSALAKADVVTVNELPYPFSYTLSDIDSVFSGNWHFGTDTVNIIVRKDEDVGYRIAGENTTCGATETSTKISIITKDNIYGAVLYLYSIVIHKGTIESVDSTKSFTGTYIKTNTSDTIVLRPCILSGCVDSTTILVR